jgi:hypothetical protein
MASGSVEENDPHRKLREDLLRRISAPDVVPEKLKATPEKLPDLVDRMDQLCEVLLRESAKDPRLRQLGIATTQFAILSAAQASHADQPFAEAVATYIKDRVALGTGRAQMLPPREIEESLKLFRETYPSSRKTAFIIMRFSGTQAHSNVHEAIRATLQDHGIVGLRADDRQFHDDLLYNILTYVFGCTFSIAVFERIETDEFNPNVSFEVGYAMAIRKPVCLLKDRTLTTLQTDLIGKLYRAFDPHDARTTIAEQLGKWIGEKGW